MNKNTIITTVLLTGTVIYLNAQQIVNPMLSGPYFGLEPPTNIPKIFAPGIVSTDMYNHSSISISPDGREIYWAMAPLDTPLRIYYSVMEDNGHWSVPKITPFTLSENGDCPVLSSDGKKMYFNSNRSIETGGRRERIWCVEKLNGEWGKPYPLGPEINGQHLHWQISVDKSGNIYFGSERTGSKGRDDIFYSKLSNNTYHSAISLHEPVNSSEHESTPYVDPNAEYLIFYRDGLWISFSESDGSWGDAIPMGELIDGSCPYVSPDGEFLFFLKMGMGFNDVYWVSTNVIKELKKSGQ